MIINGTNETIELVLGATVAANQASFSCSYNKKSSSTLTPYEINGSSNNTTAVTLVSSPSSGEEHQVRSFYLENNDTASITVTIRFNNTSVTRTIFKAIIAVGESLSYTAEKGWSVLDGKGNKEFKTKHIHPYGNISMPELLLLPSYAVSLSLTTSTSITCLGRSKKDSPTLTLRYEITNAINNPTWAEFGVYTIRSGQGITHQNVWERITTLDTLLIWNSIGQKTTSLTLTNINEGDVVFILTANIATTSAQFRAGGIADQTFSGLLGTTTGSWRPSIQLIYVSSNYTASNGDIAYIWQLT